MSAVHRNDAERNALTLQWAGLVPWALRRLRHHAAVRRNWAECRGEGYLALLRAAAAWDETRGVMFSVFAASCIRNAILNEAVFCRRRPTLFGNLTRDEDDRPFDPADPDHEVPDLGLTEDLERLPAALAVLCPRDRQVLVMHYGLHGQDECPLREVGAALGVSKSRARQIKERAVGRMARVLNHLGRSAEGSPVRLA